ncbi:aminotransferase class V-fold PLP-dependent enzyme [Carboxydocella sp. ULO1]|uniref:aminotransferase class V-fold PLP-dependent enzyme n=1 Tax=Carboxydocella sp. ULO1 TaxID=1926599 RepID=UPI0009C7F9ED|nr:aminotransferase class V-fold PLP-dependent enzyme [Carboxydocella sp. ULO1]GAW28763.1 cysteine desulfurase [Carboxydocella sp. ULO1]
MRIYFDNAATTFPKPQSVIDAVTNCMQSYAINAGRGSYSEAIEAYQLINDCREKVKRLLGFQHGQVVFAPSATIALNQIILGLNWQKGDNVYITPFEHNAVARIVNQLRESIGIEIIEIPVVRETFEFDLELLKETFFKKPPKALIMAHVSNVFGLITPIREISILAKKYDAIIIVDGAQAGPLLPLNDEDVDFYIFSGHKTFYGPFGIAGFWHNNKFSLNPILFGGTGSHSELLEMPLDVPYRYEVGSHNIVAISGLSAACDWLKEIGPKNILLHELNLIKKLIGLLKDLQEITIFCNENNHTGILSFNVNGFTAQEVAMILSQQYGIAVRSGLHCAPLAHGFLGTMQHGTVRVGLSYFNTEEEIELFINSISELIEGY